MGLPDSSVGKESTCSAGDLGLIPGLGRFPWRRERLPTPVFWPGEFQGLYSPWNSPGQSTRVGTCFLFQGNLPNPGIKPRSPTFQADSSPAEPLGSPQGILRAHEPMKFSF